MSGDPRDHVDVSPLEVHKPVVHTDGGPWAHHDQACPVCQENHAVLNLNTGRYNPCWACRREGWRTLKLPKWLKWLLGRDRVKRMMA